MATVSFDTLKFANRLKQAGVPEQQAEAEAEVLAEALQVNLRDLATREDLRVAVNDLETRLLARINELDLRLSGRMDELDLRLSGRMDELDLRLRGRMDDLDSRLRGRIDTLEAKVDGKFLLLQWMLGLLMGGVAALILKAFF